MAVQHLRRCLNGRDHVIVFYNDETQTLGGGGNTIIDGVSHPMKIFQRTCGQIHGSNVPVWLGKNEMMTFPVLDGTPLYLQRLGGVLYKVLADSRLPYATIAQEAWTPFTVTQEQTNETSYNAKDGTGKVTLSGGSGYYGMSRGTVLDPFEEPQLEFTGLDPFKNNRFYYRDLLDNTTIEVQFTIVEAAPGTEPPVNCNVEILGIDKQLPTSDVSTDGQITIFATGAENLEYSVQLSAWTTNNVFAGLSMAMTNVRVRDALGTSCMKVLNFYLDKQDIINLNIVIGSPPNYFGRANGGVDVYVGPEKLSNYTFLWSDGSTKASRRDLAAGDYTLTVTSLKSGNQTSQQITVAQGIGPFTVDIEVIRNNVYVDPLGQSLWYLWNDGFNEGSRENLPAGEYTFRVGGVFHNRTLYEEYYFLIGEGRHFFADNIIPMRVKVQNVGLKKNLKILGAVYLEENYLSGDFQRVGPMSMELPADANGEAVFKIESILRGYLQPDIPDLQQIGLKRLESQCKRFYMAQEEKYGDPAVIYDTTIMQYRYVLLGGINKVEYTVDDFFDVYLPNNKPFYTWQPAEKQVFVDQPEYLTFIVNEYEINLMLVQIRITLEDGTVLEDTLMTWEQPERYELYRFPAGFSQLQLSGYEINKRVVSYELWVEDELGVPLTETRKFTLNRSTMNRRYFLYLNALGGFDTLTAVGKISSQFRVEKLTFERELPYDHPLTESEIYTLRKEGVQTTNVPVGFGSAEMMKSFSDFALSEMVFLLQGQRLIPIDIDASPVTEDELDNLPGIEFDYQLPKDRKYTPDLSTLRPLVGEPLKIILVETALVTTGGNGAIEIAVLDGTPPYTFSWSNGASTQNINNLVPGTYSVAVYDSSTPLRYGRLNRVQIIEAMSLIKPHLGLGGFEEWDTASFNNRHILSGSAAVQDGTLEIVSNIVRTGTKSLKISVVDGVTDFKTTFPEIRDNQSDYNEVSRLQKSELKWRVSVWIYIPTVTTMWYQQNREWYVDFSKIAIEMYTGSSSNSLRTYTATANPTIRDQWQYMECIVEASPSWLGSMQTDDFFGFELGYLRKDIDSLYSILLAGGEYYLDDFSFGVIPS